MIYSHELEQHLLSGIIKHPESFFEISNLIEESDFRANGEVNKTIFKITKQALEAGESIDDVIISQRIKELNISFDENVNVFDYLKSLSMRMVSKESILQTAKDLKKLSIRQNISNQAIDVASQMKKMKSSASFEEIIDTADASFNKNISSMFSNKHSPENIFEDMEEIIEDRGNNPQTEFGMMGPHKSINNMYGSLLRPGNITVIVSRSGVGKTTFCLDYCTKVSLDYGNVPVLHFDNGEMSKEELLMRQCAALSGVPMYYLETGNWRRNEDFVKKLERFGQKLKT